MQYIYIVNCVVQKNMWWQKYPTFQNDADGKFWNKTLYGKFLLIISSWNLGPKKSNNGLSNILKNIHHVLNGKQNYITASSTFAKNSTTQLIAIT